MAFRAPVLPFGTTVCTRKYDMITIVVLSFFFCSAVGAARVEPHGNHSRCTSFKRQISAAPCVDVTPPLERQKTCTHSIHVHTLYVRRRARDTFDKTLICLVHFHNYMCDWFVPFCPCRGVSLFSPSVGVAELDPPAPSTSISIFCVVCADRDGPFERRLLRSASRDRSLLAGTRRELPKAELELEGVGAFLLAWLPRGGTRAGENDLRTPCSYTSLNWSPRLLISVACPCFLPTHKQYKYAQGKK